VALFYSGSIPVGPQASLHNIIDATALLIFFVTSKFASLYLFGGLLNDGKSGFYTKAAGCLSWIVGGSVLDGILVTIVVVTLMPIMLGGKSITEPLILLNMSINILLVGIGVGIIGLLAESILGIHDIHGLEVFFQSYIVFIFFFPLYTEQYYPDVELDGIYPGFWYTVGFFIVGLSFAYGIYMLIFFALDWYWEEKSSSFDSIITESTSHEQEEFFWEDVCCPALPKDGGFPTSLHVCRIHRAPALIRSKRLVEE